VNDEWWESPLEEGGAVKSKCNIHLLLKSREGGKRDASASDHAPCILEKLHRQTGIFHLRPPVYCLRPPVYCLDSQRVEANEAFGNTSHTIPGSPFTGDPDNACWAAGRPASIAKQHRYQNIDLQRCTGSGTEPCQAAVNEDETQKSGDEALFLTPQ